jgi:hypothetical protein
MRNTGKGARADQRKTEIEKGTIRQTKVKDIEDTTNSTVQNEPFCLD